MRLLLTGTLTIMSFCVGGQNISPYPNQDERILDANMRALERHGLKTQMTYFELNFVDLRIQEFLSKYLMMTPKGESTISGREIKTLTQKYHKKIQVNYTKEHEMTISYTLVPFKNRLVIKSVKIDGYSDYVVTFFIKYWNPELQFESAKKQELVVANCLQDRIALSIDLLKETASIKVTNTSISNWEEFLKIFQAQDGTPKIENSNNESFKKTYDLKDVSTSAYQDFEDKVLNAIKYIVHVNTWNGVSKNKVLISIEPNTEQKVFIQNFGDIQLHKIILTDIQSIKVNPPRKDGEKVSMIGEFDLNVEKYASLYKVSKFKEKIEYAEKEPREEEKTELSNFLNGKEDGYYTIRCVYLKINDKLSIIIDQQLYDPKRKWY